MLNPVDIFLNMEREQQADKKIIWEHVGILGLGLHLFHCVVRELRWIKRIGGIQFNEGNKNCCMSVASA